MSFEKNTFAVVGLGYVGIPLAIAAAQSGIATIGIDIDVNKVNKLNSGHSPINDLSDSQIASVIKEGIFNATTLFSELSKAEFIAVCVPTPLDSNNQPDISTFIRALEQVGQYLSEGAVVIIESTIAPGMVREVALPILVSMSNGKNFGLVYSPERIDPSNQSWSVKNTPKLMAGIDPASYQRASELYGRFIEEIIEGSTVETIEAAKLLENTFRLINISFINEFEIFCHKMQLDVNEVIKAAATKPYGFMKFSPGAGIGGHCIPVDPVYLASKARELGAPTHFIDHALDLNRNLGDYIADRIEDLHGPLAGTSIMLVGVAYKPNVADVRETPALGLRRAFEKRGVTILWHDEKVGTWLGEESSAINSLVDLILLVNPHSASEVEAIVQIAQGRCTPVLDVHGVQYLPGATRG